MDDAPMTAAHGSRIALAEFIDRRIPEILHRWSVASKTDLPETEVSAHDLRNALPDYLHRIAGALRGDQTIEQGGALAWSGVASEHAITRVRQGFDVDQLVREFIRLRQALLSVAADEHVELDGSQTQDIADLIDAAIAVGVRTYVQSRDYAARQREAEHIGFLSHELKNPLGTAKLAAGRLRRLSTATGGGGMRELDILDQNLDRLRLLIDGVLNMERLESGQAETQRQSMPLGDLLESPVAAADAAAREKGLTLATHVDAEARICVDRELATSAIGNVLDNAVKYTDQGTIEVSSEVRPDRVTLRVHDNCPGMSNEELSILFEPFRRGRSSQPGTGLGLAIARRALEAQGGSIGAESAEERGCCFWIELPRERP
jgi:signal transduction histidine kinase